MLNALKNEKIASVVLSVQALGVVFYIVFFLAYGLGLPSIDNLVGDPTFRLLMQVFGGLFLTTLVASFFAFMVAGRKK